jgi:hypothetical protein
VAALVRQWAGRGGAYDPPAQGKAGHPVAQTQLQMVQEALNGQNPGAVKIPAWSAALGCARIRRYVLLRLTLERNTR